MLYCLAFPDCLANGLKRSRAMYPRSISGSTVSRFVRRRFQTDAKPGSRLRARLDALAAIATKMQPCITTFQRKTGGQIANSRLLTQRR